MSINQVKNIDDGVKVNHVLISVSDKSGLDELVNGLLEINPGVGIFSTGGTFKRIKEILGGRADSVLTQVSDYTGQPETQGGLVKTLDFKIYLGLLTETYNDSHQSDLDRTGAVRIDMVVVNLYPFKETIARQDVTVEEARGQIDIGGPCMIRAAAKNFIRVAPLTDPSDYSEVLNELTKNEGRIPFETRYKLARKAFALTAGYDQAIAGFLSEKSVHDAGSCYEKINSNNEKR